MENGIAVSSFLEGVEIELIEGSRVISINSLDLANEGVLDVF